MRKLYKNIEKIDGLIRRPGYLVNARACVYKEKLQT
jgi:hypothetical protein